MLPRRYLHPDAAVCWCGDYPLAEVLMSQDMLQFEQALEASDPAAATDAVGSALSSGPHRNFAQNLKRLMPYQMRLLSRFDDSMHRPLAIPEQLIRQLQTLPQSADTAALHSGFSGAVKAAIQALDNRQSVLHPVIKRAMDVIGKSYGSDINLKIVADQLNMHPSYFGQLFREETGQSFNDCLTGMRLRKARDLLVSTDRRIGEIAGSIGIAQQSYFNRLFKKEYGITPVEYRRTLIGKAR
jgi:YesN/AraC family two-component response regulator